MKENNDEIMKIMIVMNKWNEIMIIMNNEIMKIIMKWIIIMNNNENENNDNEMKW